MGLGQLVIHEVETAIPESVGVPREVLILIGDIDVEPYHIVREVIEIEAEIHIGHVLRGEVGPPTLMIAQGEIGWQGGHT